MSRRPTLVLTLLFLVSLPAVTARLGSDEIQFFAWLRSVAFDRDADLDTAADDTGIFDTPCDALAREADDDTFCTTFCFFASKGAACTSAR